LKFYSRIIGVKSSTKQELMERQ